MYPPLSARERQVLELTCHGLELSEIAVQVGICKSSVSEVFGSLYRKFGARSRCHMVAIAVQLGVVVLPADHLMDAFRTLDGAR